MFVHAFQQQSRVGLQICFRRRVCRRRSRVPATSALSKLENCREATHRRGPPSTGDDRDDDSRGDGKTRAFSWICDCDGSFGSTSCHGYPSGPVRSSSRWTDMKVYSCEWEQNIAKLRTGSRGVWEILSNRGNLH